MMALTLTIIDYKVHNCH